MARNSGTQSNYGYKELKAEIRQGMCRTLYVIYGEENFLIEKLIESLAQLLISPGSQSLDRVVLDAAGNPGYLDPDRLKAEVRTPPFLSKRKLIIVKNSCWLTTGSSGRGTAAAADIDMSDHEAAAEESEETAGGSAGSTLKSRQEIFVQILNLLSDSVCLVFIEQKVDRRLKHLVNLIEQKGVLAEIGREPPATLQQWIEAECRRRHLAIDQAASESLIERCDSSMQIIWQELSKLFLYCDYTKCSSVDLALVSELSLPDLRGNIFDLTESLSNGQTERALLLVDTLISQKQPVQLIQFMLARHLRQLICAAELKSAGKIAEELKVMPFVANRLAGQARRLALPTLEELYSLCVDTDIQVKTGKMGDRLALETYLATASERIKKAGRR